MKSTWVLLVLLCGCGSPTPQIPYYQHNYSDQFADHPYSVLPDAKTEEGIRVDTSGIYVDLKDLDMQTGDVEDCLKAQFGSGRLPPELVQQASCDSDQVSLPIVRSWLTVKVAKDFLFSCDGSQEVLPVQAPDVLCVAKGETPTAMCPCYWRAGIEQNRYIVVTPNLYLFKDPLIRMVTGCDNPWVGALATCAQP